tara:strand:+ start:657 stop:1229 length:573 start_codon:yes stop_codon:yes gene_type:complete
MRIGYKSNLILKKSLISSKYLSLNSFTVPSCKRIRLTFPLYESEGILKSKSVMILLEFLEQLTNIKPFIKKVSLIVGQGLWVKGQVDLSGFQLNKFFLFFNEFFLSHPLLRFSSCLPILKVVQKNNVKLIVSEIDFFFDASTRRYLPHNKFYWLECDFFFDNNFILNEQSNIFFYTQFFFSFNFLEWRSR